MPEPSVCLEYPNFLPGQKVCCLWLCASIVVCFCFVGWKQDVHWAQAATLHDPRGAPLVQSLHLWHYLWRCNSVVFRRCMASLKLHRKVFQIIVQLVSSTVPEDWRLPPGSIVMLALCSTTFSASWAAWHPFPRSHLQYTVIANSILNKRNKWLSYIWVRILSLLKLCLTTTQ